MQELNELLLQLDSSIPFHYILPVSAKFTSFSGLTLTIIETEREGQIEN